MNKPTALAVSAILIAGVAAEAAAHGRHHHGNYRYGYHSYHGYHIGSPLWWGVAYRPYPYPYAYSYPYAYDYRPSTVIIEREPTVYVQREALAPVTPAASGPAPLWFYCTDPAGYFPYVQNCSRPWISVDPDAVTGPSGQ